MMWLAAARILHKTPVVYSVNSFGSRLMALFSLYVLLAGVLCKCGDVAFVNEVATDGASVCLVESPASPLSVGSGASEWDLLSDYEE